MIFDLVRMLRFDINFVNFVFGKCSLLYFFYMSQRACISVREVELLIKLPTGFRISMQVLLLFFHFRRYINVQELNLMSVCHKKYIIVRRDIPNFLIGK